MTTPNSVVFVDAHEPALEAGTYEITVTQALQARGTVPFPGLPAPSVNTELTTSARLHVLGPRTALAPAWIESRFPHPADGQDAGVLPHVVLTRSTLPWERNALRGAERRPWLAVVLLTEDEITGGAGLPSVVEGQERVDALRVVSTTPAFPGLGDERGPADADLVRVLDVPRALVVDLLPAASWLSQLTHVRERFVVGAPGSLADELDLAQIPSGLRGLLADHGTALGPDARVRVEVLGAQWCVEGESTLYVQRPASPASDLVVTAEARAVVLGCRATVPGSRYRAYLVSVEGRYVDRPATAGEPHPDERFRFDFGGALGDADPVRFVVLDRWDFAVDAGAGRLRDLLAGLVGNPVTTDLAVPVDGRSGTGVDMLRAGYALLPHRLRNGGRVRSWYRGPLTARRVQSDPPPPPHEVADALLLADVDTGILLTSYAAAWELGRVLATADPAVGLELLRWRTDRRRHAHRLAASAAHPHLVGPTGEPPGLSESVIVWLTRLLLFDGVPFGYLVPDPAMLPPGSLRTFEVDRNWLAALFDGALSAGRPITPDPDTERELLAEVTGLVAAHLTPPGEHLATVSGCLIRSEVVSGWPELHVDGWGDPARSVRRPVLRRARLSDNVLLVLFLGDVGLIDLHPNPEALHHGLDLGGRPGHWTWRLAGGHLDGAPDVDPVPMRPRREVLDVTALRQRPDRPGTDYASDEFALRMVAGVPRLSLRVHPAD